MLVHVHLLGVFGINMMTKLPPLSILSRNYEHILEGEFQRVDISLDFLPLHLIELWVALKQVSSVRNHFGFMFFKIPITKNHQSRDCCELEKVPEYLGLFDIKGHDINSFILLAARFVVFLVPVTADIDDLTLFLGFKSRGTFDDKRCKFSAVGAVIRSNKDSNIVVLVHIEGFLGWNVTWRGFFVVTIVIDLIHSNGRPKHGKTPVLFNESS
mmetsp:Transcript_8929/g.16840  ORF Transcript_8929/g.16840 Transcript_8929/m.16840 type:complete len:213 (+) Transcript_8929:1888-2526(+)